MFDFSSNTPEAILSVYPIIIYRADDSVNGRVDMFMEGDTMRVSVISAVLSVAVTPNVGLHLQDRSPPRDTGEEPPKWLPGKRHFEEVVNDPNRDLLLEIDVEVPKVHFRDAVDLALQEYVLGYDDDIPEDISELCRTLKPGCRRSGDSIDPPSTIH